MNPRLVAESPNEGVKELYEYLVRLIPQRYVLHLIFVIDRLAKGRVGTLQQDFGSTTRIITISGKEFHCRVELEIYDLKGLVDLYEEHTTVPKARPIVNFDLPDGSYHEVPGHQVNRKRVRRLMQLIGLEAIYRRPNTSKPNPGHKVYPYLLRGLEINRVNQVWATDITYIPMARGFLYLVAIMDWHSRYVLAWRLSNTLEVDFCVAALEEALSKGRPQIFNTDQGSQFTSEAFTSMLLAQGVQVSMDGRGRCMDNVFVERLWRSIKYEEVYLKAYQNGTEARKGIGAYLAFYNQERPHQALGYRSPGQVFHAVSPQRCLLELPRALPSDEGLRDTPAVDSLILASPLS